VELSGEVGATPASDSRRTMGSHHGRAFGGAYRGDDECAGGLGAEVGALAWPAVSSGVSPAMARWRSCYGCCYACGRRKKRGRSGRQSGVAWGRGAASRLGEGGSAAARPTPAYGRHVAGAGWSEAGAARGRESGGEAGRAVWLGQKGGGSV